MNPWLVLSLGLSSLTIQKRYYFLSSVYANCKLWPKITKRDYGRAKKWTHIFWVLIQPCYHKLIFHLLLNNNQSVSPTPIHLQPDGVLICGGHFISCWQFHKPFKAFAPVIFFPVPQEIGSFLQDFTGKLACLFWRDMLCDFGLPGAGIIYYHFFNYVACFSVFLTCHLCPSPSKICRNLLEDILEVFRRIKRFCFKWALFDFKCSEQLAIFKGQTIKLIRIHKSQNISV